MIETDRVLQNLVDMKNEEIERLKAENEYLRLQNRELVMDIRIRGNVISTLQNS